MSSGYSFQLQSTPPRRPTAHHCNAERKLLPLRTLTHNELQPLAKNLFGTQNHNCSNAVRSLR